MPEPLVESVVPSKVRPEPIARVRICDVPFPSKIPVSVVEPVPPFATVSAVASVSAPVEEKDEVAEPPKYATVAESCVEDAAPLKSIKEVVADWPDAGWVKASYVARPEPVMVIGAEPRTVKPVQDAVPAQETEVVATPYTPAPPFETRRLDVDG